MKQIRNLPISRRMALSFGIVILLMLALAAVSARTLMSLNDDLRRVTQDYYVKVRLTGRVSQEIALQGKFSRDSLILSAEQMRQEIGSIQASRERIRKYYETSSPTWSCRRAASSC